MTAEIRGKSLISGRWISGDAGTVTASDPATDEEFGPEFTLLSAAQVREATAAAAEAFRAYRAAAPTVRAEFLDEIATEIESRREAIVARAGRETGLPAARLTGEVARTANQLRLFGTLLRSGEAAGARIDPALPDRAPAPRVDIRQRRIPIGPVAVFGASNFPLAFSTAGGDTAAALAAGCPVVFKAHNAHPGTAELVADAIASAIEKAGIHPGVFSLVYGAGTEVGQMLAADPTISAVAFTGSRAGGTALFDTAVRRDIPIPVFAEMSAANPVVVLPGALSSGDELGAGFFGSVTGSAGQLCTKPGLIFVPAGEAGDAFVRAAGALFEGAEGQTMLTRPIAEACVRGIARLKAHPGVRVIGEGLVGEGRNAPAPVLFETALEELAADPALSEEVFGPTSTVVRYAAVDELDQAVQALEGQLTVTFHAGDSDAEDVSRLLPDAEAKAGRILFGGWPTGVEVGHAMVHGGPFPATSDGRTTSVGTGAIERFLRPVAYQSFPEALLPEPIADADPWGAPRLVDGRR